MSLLGTLLKKGVELRSKATLPLPKEPALVQRNTLKKLLLKAQDTDFGRTYHFGRVLDAFYDADPKAYYRQYCAQVPVHDYNSMFDRWWHRCLAGEEDVTWPGPVKYFALSSGTSEASTKHIPVSGDMIRSIQRTAIRQILTLPSYDLPSRIFNTGVLMLGGSTDLSQKGHYYEGDLSGIQASRIPMWFQAFYKPGKKISMMPDWNTKLDEMTTKAKDWDIGVIAGVPAWVQILMEKIIAYYKVDTIHDIWPNLAIYVHGGVSFEPYRKSFDKLLGKPLVYMETYLASEGYLGMQYKPDTDMKLMLNNGIFMEFVPFNEENFDADGNLVAQPTTLMIDEVEEGQEYALLLSTCAGTWRYLIGDTVKITDKRLAHFVITGRTKHFISLCGEHLSVENMSKAISLTCEELNVSIKEFAVAGVPMGTLFGHHWYIGVDAEVDEQAILASIDQKLKVLNDDYRVERAGPLCQVMITALPSGRFYAFMKHMGKEGGQNKFPRVLKKRQLEAWNEFLSLEQTA